MAFASLLASSGETNALFPEMVLRSHLNLYLGNCPGKKPGLRIALAVALWSKRDLELLDEIDRPSNAEVSIEVLNIDLPAQTQESLQAIFPGARVLQPPVMSAWLDGVFVETSQGFVAALRTRELLGQAAGRG